MKGEPLHTNQSGFSLVEILIAVAIFIVFAGSILNISPLSGRQAKYAVNKERATQLAEEGLEALRNIRDADYVNLNNGTHGLAVSGNQFNLSGSSDNTGIYTRAITISTIGSEKKKADVVVSWVDDIIGGGSVSLSTYLSNWRALINIGLTISKNVTNHGGSLTPNDFLPTDFETTSYDFSVDPPVAENISIPIVFSPSTMSLVPGTYTFTTTNNPDYQLTLSPACNSGSIVLNEGDAKLCSINYEEYYVPIVTSPTSADITQTTATLGANVTSLGLPSSISERGVCYDTSPLPVVNCTPEGATTTGVFTQSITGLTLNTAYYFRGYATNAKGTGYSEDGTFTTQGATTTPTVTTTAPSSITQTTASSGGEVTSDGGAVVTSRGVVWDTSVDPTIALSTKTSDGTGTGSFVSSITGLTCNTTYYVRAYATNSVGTAYGANESFTTSPCGSNIIYVGSATAGGTTASIPARNVGDLLVAFAYRDGNASPPTVPAGWTTIDSSGNSNANASVLAYRIATGVEPTAGWSNANEIIVHAYRGVSGSPIGANSRQASSGTTVTYPAISLNITNGTSWVIGFAGHRSTDTNLQNAPAGMTNRSTRVDATAEVAGHDTNAGVSSWSATNVSVGGTSSGWMTRVLEIKSQ